MGRKKSTVKIPQVIEQSVIKGAFHGQGVPPHVRAAIRALVDMGASYRDVMEQFGVSRETVRKILREGDINPKLLNRVKEEILTRMWTLASEAISHITPEKLAETKDIYKLALVVAIAVDKARLMEGGSTQNIAIVSKVEHHIENIEKIKKEIEEIKSEIEKENELNNESKRILGSGQNTAEEAS